MRRVGKMKNKISKIVTLATAIVLLASCLFALCACNQSPDAFKKDTRFDVDYNKLNLMDMNPLLVTTIVGAAVDKDNTYVEFKKNGMMHLQIQTKANLLAEIPKFIKTLEKINIKIDLESALSSFDVKTSVDRYVEPMFPGFTQKLKSYDLEGALELIRHSLGFNIEGLDYSDKSVKEAAKYVGDNMALPPNLFDLIPKDTVLRLTLDTQYAIRNLTASDGTKMRAIYLGYKVKDNPHTAPFGVFTLSNEDREGSLSIEFMNIHIRIKQAA